MKNNIEDLVKEALLINTRIKKDKDRLSELKDKILEDSTGKNTSYKIETESGLARVIKYKDKLTYSFDESSFKSLDEEKDREELEQGLFRKTKLQFIQLIRAMHENGELNLEDILNSDDELIE